MSNALWTRITGGITYLQSSVLQPVYKYIFTATLPIRAPVGDKEGG